MKKVKKIITGFLTVFIFMALVLPMTTVKASEKKEAVEKRSGESISILASHRESMVRRLRVR